MSSSRSLRPSPRRCTTPHEDRGRPGPERRITRRSTRPSSGRLPPPQPVLFSLYDEEPSGRRPASLAEPPGQQERIQRRTVEQPAEIAPIVQILDAPVPQTVDQLVEVLRPLDTVVPEQVMDVPKITLHDAIPQRAVLPVRQMAEQLVDEPLPSFDSFELVQVGEEEDEEDEHPQVVPGSRISDAHGRAWCRVVGADTAQ